MSSLPRPLFCGTELAARLERAESALIADGAGAAARRRPGSGVFAHPLAGGRACYGGAGSPLNKVAGLGFAGRLDEDELAKLERLYAERGEAVRVELASLGEPEIATQLTRRGYQLVGFEDVLGLPLPGARAGSPAAGIEIEECGADDFERWLDLVVDGFAHPDLQGVASDEEFPREVMASAIGDLAATQGFRRFLARRGGELAGGASCRFADGVAQLCGAATLPTHRRHGIQSSLLAHRLAAAAAAGCDLAVVTTQPGSKSQENVQRQGFSLLYTRAVLLREP